jgi:2-polyprenyl-3-methyl-5-hydroxy-6-metoxy-1,4-benzoquinol methylase
MIIVNEKYSNENYSNENEKYKYEILNRPNCPLCGSEGNYIYKDLKDRLYNTSGSWDMRICTNTGCNLQWLDPAISKKDIGIAYNTYYTHDNSFSSINESKLCSFFRITITKLFNAIMTIAGLSKERFMHYLMYLSEGNSKKLLEIGFGDGNRMMHLEKLGWDVSGIEVDQKAIDEAKKKSSRPVFQGELFDAGFEKETFDAIIMNHVIEHTYEPVEIINECFRILKKDGKLVFMTPNVESLGARIFKKNWRDLDPPRHINLFSPKSLRELIGKTQFNDCKIFTSSVNAQVTSIGSINISLEGRHTLGKESKLSREIMSMLFQIFAGIYHFFKPDSGEECVLIVEK